MWLGSHTKLTFWVYFVMRLVTSCSRLGLKILLPDAIACEQLYESLNMLIFWSELLITHRRANFIAESSAAKIVTLSLSLTLNKLFRFYAAFILGCCGSADIGWLTLLRAACCVLASGVLLLSFRLLTALAFQYVFGVALFFSAELFRYITNMLAYLILSIECALTIESALTF